MDVRVAPDATSAASLAAAWIARRLIRSVAVRGRAAVAFSGGSTPAPMLSALAAMAVPWDRIEIFQVDERVAPDGDPARNRALFDLLHIDPTRVVAMPVTVRDLRAGARRYAARLPDRFDVVHLGLGDDGHTASWPPGDPVVDSSRTVDLSTEYQGLVRMTLTPPVINAARTRVVLATGATKRPVLERWLRGDRSIPIQRVHRTGTIVFLDEAAAPVLHGRMPN